MIRHTLQDLLEPNRKHSGTPEDLQLRGEARRPEIDPTLGIDVQQAARPEPKHRLVTLGDSLSQGFQNAAVFNTTLSWPRLLAWELGSDDQFFVPRYDRFGGLPFNLETLLVTLQRNAGPTLDSTWELVRAAVDALAFYEEVSSYWSKAWAEEIPNARVHNLSAFGWDVFDLSNTTAETCRQDIAERGSYLKTAEFRSAYRVLATARGSDGSALTPIQAAQHFGSDGGIETLVVMIGSNNALRSVTSLEVVWSEDHGFRDREIRRDYTVWRPTHFRDEYDRLVAGLEQIDARHVILSTVPHVTVPPITRGVSRNGEKIAAGSRYFEYYTRPWIEDREFDWRDDACITASQARAIDSAIDDYNDHITEIVRRKRNAGADWYLFDIAGLLDRLASRRYLEDEAARPSWWNEVGGAYSMPRALRNLGLNSHFFRANETGRLDGGLFSLDGVHPTTIGYGIIAQEIVNILHAAGVEFRFGNGLSRPGPIAVDFERLLRLDSLFSAPPPLTHGLLKLLSILDARTDGILARLGLHWARP